MTLPILYKIEGTHQENFEGEASSKRNECKSKLPRKHGVIIMKG